jgi:hypothetical protein
VRQPHNESLLSFEIVQVAYSGKSFYSIPCHKESTDLQWARNVRKGSTCFPLRKKKKLEVVTFAGNGPPH